MNEPYKIEPYKIEFASAKDASHIAKFNIAMAKETEDKVLDPDIIAKGVSYIFENPEYGLYVVARKGDEPVACLMVTYEWSDWRNGLFLWIQSVYVVPECRRQGLYRQMYEFVKQYAGGRSDICGFRLYAEKDNLKAQETYKKLGMNEAGYLIFQELS